MPLKSLPTLVVLTSLFVGHSSLVLADVVTADDAIIQGSLAVGLDAVNGEVFGFDTLRLKENNARLQFDDTSATADFPTNNWQIRANSSAINGGNFLAFVDQGDTGNSETGTIIFQVDAGAPANSLRVDSTGRIGLRTATPVLDLHLNTSNSPGMRLEQNNSGGFTGQTWDIAGNEANFYVRDVTGGSRLPFRIRPGAPTSSIDIAADGDVGIGTSSPNAKMHIVADAALGQGVLIGLAATAANTATLHVEGTAFITQTLEIGSSRTRKENIEDLTLAEAREAFVALKPVQFNYKSDTEHQLGFIAEDVPDLVATESRKSLVPMDFIAVLTKVSQDHEAKVKSLEQTVAGQQALLKAMAARLDALERRGPAVLTASLPPSPEQLAERAKRMDRPESSPASATSKSDQPPPAKLPSKPENNGR